MFRNKVTFYGEQLLAPHPNPKLEDHTLSAVRHCLFNISAATLHIGGLSSIRNLRTRHAVVTGTIYITELTFRFRKEFRCLVASCLVNFGKPEILLGWSFLFPDKESECAEEEAVLNETLNCKPAAWILMNSTVHKLLVSFQ